jgi:DNA polymerase-3 subunit epsilon
MRQIILDTETTGLNPATGDRIIEIGCIELINRRQTGKTLHHYINPDRDIDEGAFAVHGLSREFLMDKPLFMQIIDELTDFIKDAEVIIHNAPFDLSFLNNEYTLLKRPHFSEFALKITDTLVDARRMFPGKRNSLDALCERFAVSNEHRTLHGALLDAQLLAEVYLAMTRGQDDLTIDLIDYSSTGENGLKRAPLPDDLIYIKASELDCAAHERVLAEITKANKKTPVWDL